MDPTNAANPFRDPARKPQWAELTRLAGDRAAILFEDLRRRVGGLNGLIEERHFGELGWGPRYRIGEITLFSAVVLPARIEASIDLGSSLAERLLRSTRTSKEIKRVLASAEKNAGSLQIRLPLTSAGSVCSLARLVLAKGHSLVRAAAR